MEIITTANNKGGQTKTTNVVTMSSYLAMNGYKVLTVDLDPQGNILKWLEIEKNMPFEYGVEELLQSRKTQVQEVAINIPDRANWQLVPADSHLNYTRDFLVRQPRTLLAEKLRAADYDYILIDTGPAIDHLFWQAICAADVWIMPVTPDYLAEQGITSALEYLAEARKDNENLTELIILPAKMIPHTEETRTAMDEIEEFFGAFVAEPIPYSEYMRKLPRTGKSIFETWPKSAPALAYEKFMTRWC